MEPQIALEGCAKIELSSHVYLMITTRLAFGLARSFPHFLSIHFFAQQLTMPELNPRLLTAKDEQARYDALTTDSI